MNEETTEKEQVVVRRGHLVIIATGTPYVKFFVDSAQSLVDTVESSKTPLEFYGECVIIRDAQFFVDSRQRATKRNKLVCYGIFKALEEGRDVILLTPQPEMIDKRLRKSALILRLPSSE